VLMLLTRILAAAKTWVGRAFIPLIFFCRPAGAFSLARAAFHKFQKKVSAKCIITARLFLPMYDELLDLVDEQDRVIGTKKRSEVYANNLKNFRVINVFLINENGEIWIPRRTVHKRIFSLCLDMSAAGHVETGETYDQTFKRETMEELTIDTDEVPHRLLGHLRPQTHGVSTFMNVYEIRMNAVPKYNQNDFSEYFLLTPNTLLDRIAAGEKTKGDLPKLVEYFYSP